MSHSGVVGAVTAAAAAVVAAAVVVAAVVAAAASDGAERRTDQMSPGSRNGVIDRIKRVIT